MKSLRRRESQIGMTLIEVVTALAILSVLLVVAYGSLSSINRSKRAIDDYQDVYLVAQSLLRRVTRELQLVTCDKGADTNCTRGRGVLPPEDKPDEKTGPMLLSESSRGGKESSITFLALEAGQYLPEGDTRSGMVQITYRLGKVNRDDKLSSFIRDEIPYLFPPQEAYKKRITFPVCKNVVSFDLQFYQRDADVWSSEWGTKPNSQSNLPTLIKFSLVLRSENGMDLPFETIVPVRTSLQP